MEAESLSGLYFAAPPEEVDFINSIRDFFKTRNKLVATGKDVENTLKIVGQILHGMKNTQRCIQIALRT